jgi:hypothetical protein
MAVSNHHAPRLEHNGPREVSKIETPLLPVQAAPEVHSNSKSPNYFLV